MLLPPTTSTISTMNTIMYNCKYEQHHHECKHGFFHMKKNFWNMVNNMFTNSHGNTIVSRGINPHHKNDSTFVACLPYDDFKTPTPLCSLRSQEYDNYDNTP